MLSLLHALLTRCPYESLKWSDGGQMVSWATNCTELRLGGRSIGDKKAIAISEFMGDSPQLLAILLVRACHCLGRPECETHDCRGVHALQEDCPCKPA